MDLRASVTSAPESAKWLPSELPLSLLRPTKLRRLRRVQRVQRLRSRPKHQRTQFLGQERNQRRRVKQGADNGACLPQHSICHRLYFSPVLRRLLHLYLNLYPKHTLENSPYLKSFQEVLKLVWICKILVEKKVNDWVSFLF